MTRISVIILNFITNAGWQIAVIFTVASIGSYLLRNAAANFRYMLWVVVLGLSVAAPLLTVAGFSPRFALPASNVKTSQPILPRSDSPPPTNNGESDAAPLGRLLVRKTQIVTAAPRNFVLLGAALTVLMLLRLIRLVRLWVRKERLLRFASGISFTHPVETSIARCRDAFGGRKFEVLCSAETAVPVTLGARRPVIILPEHFCAELDEETLVSVIGHEVAHVSRHDYALNLICELVSLPISVHPLTYLIKREIERSRELACDESVTKLLLGPRTYARSLVRVANVTMPGTRSLVLSILDGNILEQRIMKLTHAKTRVRRGLARTITLAALSVLGVVVIVISNLSFDLRAYADSQSATAFGVNIESGTLIKEGEGKPFTAPKLRPSGPGQSKATNSPEQSGTEQNAQERARAACAAAQEKSFDSIPRLIAMLGDDSQSELIRCWEGTRWSPALDTFKQPSPGEQAALALASLGPPAFEPLANQLSSSNATVRRNAAWAIGELTGMIPGARAGAVPPLITLLTDADPWVRMAAARALGELHDRRATTAMVAALSDHDWRVRELSAWALSEMKDRGAVNALCIVLLSDPRAEVRRQAAEALGEIRSAEALASLKQALNDAEPRVRAKAGWAISEIEG